MKKIISSIKKRLICLKLDLFSIPGFFMGKKKNAIFHLNHICPKCPTFRRKMRDIQCNGKCWWYVNWKAGKYHIHRHFGLKNFISQYIFLQTNLRKYKEKLKRRGEI